jgi:phage baseplate assembly protein W
MASINIAFPLEDDNIKKGLFKMNDLTKRALVSDLTLLLVTVKGERYMYPTYGTNLLKFIFEPKDGLTISEVENDLRITVKEFIPQLTITNVDFFSDDADGDGDPVGDNEIKVVIDFTYKDNAFSEQGSLTLGF